ncbi:MAG: MgtC/SapB family protein [Clostridia bacterium]|nr:MgtC/SapB family protein [Clostridia bacterium]
MINLTNDPMVNIFGEWIMGLNIWSILFRIFLSVLLSAIIGCERASKRHSAGLRTFILVSLASTMAMIIDIFLIQNYGLTFAMLSATTIVSTAMLSGNSILFSSRNQIKGLTTSVGLWGCGIIGLSLGAGLYTLTLISYLTFICCLSVFPALEKYLKDKSNHFEVHLELKNKSNLQDFVTTIRRLGLKIDDIESNPAYLNSGLSVYSVSITISSEELKKYKKHSEIIEALRTLDYVYYIEEMN